MLVQITMNILQNVARGKSGGEFFPDSKQSALR